MSKINEYSKESILKLIKLDAEYGLVESHIARLPTFNANGDGDCKDRLISAIEQVAKEHEIMRKALECISNTSYPKSYDYGDTMDGFYEIAKEALDKLGEEE